MKRVVASAGLVALGVASLHAAYAPGLTPMEKAKPWSLSLALKGFYDDNPTTSPRDFAEESFGIEVSPAVSLNLPLDQTFISAGYVYSMRWYENRPDDNIDQTHRFNAKVDHAFSQRFKMELSDSFVIAQEPQVLSNDGIITNPIRVNGDNIRNYAKAEFTAEITKELSLVIRYANTLWDYSQDAGDIQGPPQFGFGSYSALLDRMEHLPGIDARYQLQPETVGIVGFQYGQIDYTANEQISPGFSSSYRDSRSYYFYVGADHSFNAQWLASLRGGAMFIDYPNADQDTVSPYIDLSTSYTYNPGSYVQLGFRYSHNPTDVGIWNNPGSAPTLDQQTAAIYGQINHKISGNLSGNLMGQFQHSTFNGGGIDGEVDLLFMFGANLNYRYSDHMSAELGYNFDSLDSDLPQRSYTRNVVYIGLRGTF